MQLFFYDFINPGFNDEVAGKSTNADANDASETLKMRICMDHCKSDKYQHIWNALMRKKL